MPTTVNESLSEKRRRAGKLGAAARWSNASSNGTSATRDGKNGKRPAAELEPRIVANQAEDVADVYIYGEISRWSVNAKDFAGQLAELDAKTLNVYINSPGGSVFDGLAIKSALTRHPATVNVVIDGLAASAASFIAQAGDTVTMMANSQMMIHDASTYVDVFAYPDSAELRGIIAELEKLAGFLDRQSDNVAQIYADAAGRRDGESDAGVWRQLMLAETWYFADEAVAAGLADRVDGDEGSTEQAASDEDATIAESFKYRCREDAPEPQAVKREAPGPTGPDPKAASSAPEPPATEPVFQFDPDVFRKAVKEAAS